MAKVREYTASERVKIGRNAGIVGIGANLVLFAMKLTAGLLSASISIIADAVNNLTDALSSVIVMVGYILSGKPADRKHPYGHARIEYLCTLFISIIITFLGFELLRSSVESLISPSEAAVFETVSIVIMALSIVIKLSLAIFYKAVGKKISSSSLNASAVDSLGDVCATAAVIAGMFLSRFFGPATDSVLGCLIAVYIFVMGVKLIGEASDTLLGTAPEKDTVEKVTEKLLSYDGVLGIHDLMLHNYGEGRFFASVHVEIDSREDIMLSHDKIDNIEHDFLREMGIHLVIHLDPVCVGDERVDALMERVKRLLGEIGGKLGVTVSMHDFRTVFGVTHTNLIFDVVVPFELKTSEKDLVAMIKDGVDGFEAEGFGKCFAVVTVDRDLTGTI